MLPSLYYPHRWKKIEHHHESKALAHALGLSPALGAYLLQHFSDEEEILEFLHPHEESSVIPGTPEIATRIHRAIQEGEKILLFGDYDVDGLTSLALMIQFFEENQVGVEYFVPSRYEDGYGLTPEALDKLPPCDLLVSFDCGISSYEEVEVLKKRGIDVLITDHHEPPEKLPQCPLMNPKLGYSFPDLAGVGVAYKLARYLSRHYGYHLPKDAIIFAMLGTVCDLMPLKKENRWIVQAGLEAYKYTTHPGLRALLEVTGDQNLDAGKVGFQLGPMLNAAGRMGDPRIALDLLRGKDRPLELAQQLKENNEERKEEEKRTLEEAEVRMNPEEPMIILSGPWKKGLLGLVASRLSERHRKPSILMDESFSGSCRSVGKFSILEALNQTSTHLLHYGGHDKAAGLQVNPEEYTTFVKEINAYAQESLHYLDTRKVFSFLDLEPGEVSLTLLDELGFLAPFGIGNPEPLFRLSGLRFVETRQLGRKGNAFLLLMKNGDRLFEFLHFDPELSFVEEGDYDILFTLRESEFRGIVSLRLQLKDLRPSRPSLEKSALFLPFYQGLVNSISNYTGEVGEIMYPTFEEDRVYKWGDAAFPKRFPHPSSFHGSIESLLEDLPQREDLVKIYSWLRRQGGSFKWSSANRPFLALTSLKIFEELHLLSYTSDSRRCRYSIKKQEKKMDLDSSPTYRMIQRIKEDQHGIA